jgi:hypothetical protein
MRFDGKLLPDGGNAPPRPETSWMGAVLRQ